MRDAYNLKKCKTCKWWEPFNGKRFHEGGDKADPGKENMVKTSFAPFKQEVANKDITYQRTVHIDCEQVAMVTQAIGYYGERMDGHTDIWVAGYSMPMTVIGEPEEILNTVKAFCKGTKA